MMLYAARLIAVCAPVLTLLSVGVVSAAYWGGRWQPSAELAYKCQSWQLCLIDADRGHVFDLTPNAQYSPREFTWSPDGSQLMFTNIGYEAYGIHSIDLASGNVQMFIPNATSLSWSRDGKHFAYVTRLHGISSLVVQPLEGEPRAILHDVEMIITPSWSPDSQRLVFQLRHTDSWQDALYLINADGSGFQQITHEEYQYWNPVWSPDGNQIMATWRGTGSGSVVVLIDVVTGAVKPFIDDEGSWLEVASWSPDGQRIAFSSDLLPGFLPDNLRSAIYIFNADGSNLYYVGIGEQPVWRPDPR